MKLSIKKILIDFTISFVSVHLTTAQDRVNICQTNSWLQGDSVHIEMTVDLTNITVAPKSYLLLTPVVCSDTDSMDLPTIQINGTNRHKAEKRSMSLNKENKSVGMTVKASKKAMQNTLTYKATALYEPWMRDAGLQLREDQCGCGGQTATSSFRQISRRLLPPSSPKLTVTFITPEVEPIKKRSETGKAYLDFPSGKSDILPDFRNNALELMQMYGYVVKLKDDPDATITGITLSGHASPEGMYNSNLILSGRRASALAELLKKKYGFTDDLFHITGSGEDWKTLDKLVERSDMKERDKVLAIIRSSDSFDDRERQLKILSEGVPYRDMLKEMFPQLRRCDYELHYTVVPFTVEQGKDIIKTRPSSLSLNEMSLIANTYEVGSDRFNEVCLTAAEVFPQSDVANLNAAASALNREDFVSAEKYLNKIEEKDAAYWNNMGVLAGKKKDFEKAVEYFTKACDAGSSCAAANLSEIENAK